MPSYGSNLFSGKTAAADSVEGTQVAGFACDGINTDAKGWLSNNVSFPHHVEIDLGAGNEAKIGKIRISPYADVSGAYVKNFTVEGHNGGAHETVATLLASNTTTTAQFQDFTFTPPTTAYRYWYFGFTDNYSGSNQTYVDEIEGMEELPSVSSFTPKTIFF